MPIAFGCHNRATGVTTQNDINFYFVSRLSIRLFQSLIDMDHSFGVYFMGLVNILYSANGTNP